MAVESSQSVPVSPDSVRVWTGFRRGDLSLDSFYSKLGSFFIPGTVQIQSQLGLTAYIPTVLPTDKPAGVPDEVALVFYAYRQAYHQAKESVAGRAYSDLHDVAFDLERSLSGFPERFVGELSPGGRYFLFDQHVDWQQGVANVFVGVPTVNCERSPPPLVDWLREIQGQGPRSADGAYVAVAGDYFVYWEHWPSGAAAEKSLIPQLARLVDCVYQETPIMEFQLPERLWNRFPGIPVRGGDSFNFQFRTCRQPWQMPGEVNPNE